MSTTEPIHALNPYPDNPRRGDVHAIAESLRQFGQFRTIVVNKGTHTGRPNEVLAGNHTLEAAKMVGLTSIECDWVDVDDETARKIVLIDNRAADLGTYDSEALAELIAELSSLNGTGYEGAADASTAAPRSVERETPTQNKPSGGQGHDQYDDYDKYKASDTRHLFLEWPVSDYEQVKANLDTLRREWELETNGDVVRRLIGA